MTVSVFVDDMEKVCVNESQNVSFDGFNGVVQCPNPRFMCGIRQFYGLLGPTPEPFPGGDPGGVFGMTLVQAALLGAAVVFVVSVCGLALFRRYRSQREAELNNRIRIPDDAMVTTATVSL
jgi:hypothetical protein